MILPQCFSTYRSVISCLSSLCHVPAGHFCDIAMPVFPVPPSLPPLTLHTSLQDIVNQCTWSQPLEISVYVFSFFNPVCDSGSFRGSAMSSWLECTARRSSTRWLRRQAFLSSVDSRTCIIHSRSWLTSSLYR